VYQCKSYETSNWRCLWNPLANKTTPSWFTLLLLRFVDHAGSIEPTTLLITPSGNACGPIVRIFIPQTTLAIQSDWDSPYPIANPWRGMSLQSGHQRFQDAKAIINSGQHDSRFFVTNFSSKRSPTNVAACLTYIFGTLPSPTSSRHVSSASPPFSNYKPFHTPLTYSIGVQLRRLTT
jgi:hypothetical protein